MDWWNVDWNYEREGSHLWAAERYLPELSASLCSGLHIDQVVHPKSILDIQPIHLDIHRPFKKKDMLYLLHLHRLQSLETNNSDLFNNLEEDITCLDRLNTLVMHDYHDKMSSLSAQMLGRRLKSFTQLTRLDVKCRDLNEMLPNLVPRISDLIALQHLSLWNYSTSRLDGDGMREVGTHLSKLAQLSYLHVDHLVDGEDEESIKLLCELITSLPNLTTLRLPFNLFKPTSIVILCEVISELSELTHLDLSYSTLDEGSMNMLGKVVTNLPILHLQLCKTTWGLGGIESLIAQLDDWSHLKSLNLHGSNEKISKEKTTELASELSKLTSLILLDITCCHHDDYQILLEALKSLPLQVLYLNAPKESETTLKQHFPPMSFVYQNDGYFVFHDPSFSTTPWVSYDANMSHLFPTKPVVESTLPPKTPHHWTQLGSFKPVNKNQIETLGMQPMLYHHTRYPQQVQFLCDQQQDGHISFLESILLNNELPTPPDMETALKYHRMSEIVGYNPGLIHSGDYIQQHLTPNNLVATFVYFHSLKKTLLPQRDGSGEHVECTGQSDELVCWDGLLSYLVSKWNDWWQTDDTKEQLLLSSRECGKLWLIQWRAMRPLNCEWKMKEDQYGDWERRDCLFKTTYHFLHLSPKMRPDMTLVINNGVKVIHLHSHVVWKRWGMSSHLQSRSRQVGKSKDEPQVIYHLVMSEKMAELVGCLMEYCYTGDMAKLGCLTRFQIEMIGEMETTQIYSVAALMNGTPVLDPHLMGWRTSQLAN